MSKNLDLEEMASRTRLDYGIWIFRKVMLGNEILEGNAKNTTASRTARDPHFDFHYSQVRP